MLICRSILTNQQTFVFLYFVYFVGFSSSYSRSAVTLNECKPSGKLSLYCYKQHIISIDIKSQSSFEKNTIETGDKALRLIRNEVHSPNWNSGIVQVYHEKSWGNICKGLYFGANVADVICHQLTFTGASSYSTTTATTM